MKFKLLTIGNVKTRKGQGVGYLTGVLHLAPFNLSGVNVCPMAELAGCVKACLNTAGRGGIAKGGMLTYDTLAAGIRTNRVQEARVRRTRWFLTDREGFMAALAKDIHKLALRARRLRMVPAVRLNGTSDIRWEDIPAPGVSFRIPGGGLTTYAARASIFEMFPWVPFYDYTKIPNRRRALDIPNYSLTFSYSQRPEFAGIVSKAREVYGSRVNVAVVFAGALPQTFMGRRVVSGDDTDLRFLDPDDVVVGLTAKGRAKKDVLGFVVP
jgi:hypothetical protein